MSKKKEEPAEVSCAGDAVVVDEKALTKATDAAVEQAVKKHLVFSSRTEFDIALNASTDPNIVELDGETVKGGVYPIVAFRTSPNGDIVPVEG